MKLIQSIDSHDQGIGELLLMFVILLYDFCEEVKLMLRDRFQEDLAVESEVEKGS